MTQESRNTIVKGHWEADIINPSKNGIWTNSIKLSTVKNYISHTYHMQLESGAAVLFSLSSIEEK